MKGIVKFAVLLLVGIVVFFRSKIPSVTVYWLIFVLLFILVGLLFVLFYWVSKKDVEKVSSRKPKFSMFTSRIPETKDSELHRGRMVIDQEEIALYQRTPDRERTQQTPCVKTWFEPLENLATIDFGEVDYRKKGLILYFTDGSQVKFSQRKMKKNKEMILQALGWNAAPNLSENFGKTVTTEICEEDIKPFNITE